MIDAFRVESLPENEQAAGMASYVAAYRIGMLVSTAGALFLVSGFEASGFDKQRPGTGAMSRWPRWSLIGIVTALIATEPEQSASTAEARARAARSRSRACCRGGASAPSRIS